MYLLSIAAATRSIDLAMAYFAPDEVTSEALIDAMKRGVRVRLMLPGENTDVDSCAARRARTGACFRRRGRRFTSTSRRCITEVLIVDGLWSSVGSTNFDGRSFRLNDEANLNVYDEEFARLQTGAFDADLKKTRRITYEEWENRPWHEKLKEHAAAIFSSQL